MQRAPVLDRPQRVVALAEGDRHGAAGPGRDPRRDQLGAHPARGIAGRRVAPHGHDLVGDALHHRQMRRGRVLARVGGVEPVDIRQQDQRIGAGHLGDAGGQPVVVAEADLGGGDRVVLVDDGDAAELEQGAEGGAGIQVAAAVLAVLEREEELGGRAAPGPRAHPPRRRPGGSGRPRRRPASPPASASCGSGRGRGGPARWRRRRPG